MSCSGFRRRLASLELLQHLLPMQDNKIKRLKIETSWKWKRGSKLRVAEHTETTRAEVARAKPAILVASANFWASSLKSVWREQVSLDAVGSKPKALVTLWDDLSWRVVRAGTPTLVGCIRVAAACREAAIVETYEISTLALLCLCKNRGRKEFVWVEKESLCWWCQWK